MRLTVKQLTAVLKAGLIVTNADGETKKEEMEIVVRELVSFGINQEQGSQLYDDAVAMSTEDMVDQLKGLSNDDKKYISGYLIAISVADGDVADNEAKAWAAICNLCEFPNVSVEDAYNYWKNN